ncbi:MAG: hypothetical protein GY716_10205 [bacterium]|nr:hypothetical protein [bacterium]
MLHRLLRFGFGIAIGLCLSLTAAGAGEPVDLDRPFHAVPHGGGAIAWDPAAVRSAAERGVAWTVSDFPLPGAAAAVDLVLEPFRITPPGARFVVGSRTGADRPLDFDPDSVLLFRGGVAGRPESSAVLTFSRHGVSGTIDPGAGAGAWVLRTVESLDVTQAPPFVVQPHSSSAETPPHVPACGVQLDTTRELPQPTLGLPGGGDERRGVRQIELAVETDFEYFSLFDSADAAAAYLVQLYAQVSEIYVRDVGARIDLVYFRLWDDPDDLFNEPSPLSPFQNYWNFNMMLVQRDVAQLFSGRRDYPFGGQAYLNGVCEPTGYSVVGYGNGFFEDPSLPSPYHYDIQVTAHELGHNAGTGHTHSSPNNIDTCNDPQTTPQRGTIMSYCGQTWSGGNGNRELYFHTTIQANVESFLSGATCVVFDCNGNGVDDAQDVSGGTSLDGNANAIPDECEDCNANLTLDDADISLGSSVDVNLNGIPDECEPDCNNDSIPDARNIADGTSMDLHGNGVPDECEEDCDLDGISDFSEIQSQMSLDVDRNARLDACQDCDGDDTSDIDALAGGHGMWVASGLLDGEARRFYAGSGVLTGLSDTVVVEGQDVAVRGDRHVLISSGPQHRILEFDATGTLVGDLVAPGSGGVSFPTGLLADDQGRLLVSSRNTDEVLAYDLSTGASLGVLVAAGSGGLDGPFGLTRSPAGMLLVTSSTNEVLEYDATTGVFSRVFVDAGANGGLDQPRGLTFKADGNLLVASFGSDEVLEYDGDTGAPLGKWAQVGTSSVLTQTSPWGVRVGPNGNVYVARTGEAFGSSFIAGEEHHHDDEQVEFKTDVLHLSNAQMYEFDTRNGNFLRTHIGGNDHGLLFPTGFAFIPGWDLDCNLNLIDDACDVAAGTSLDLDSSGVPDECEADCNANGSLDRLDVIPYGSSLDCNYNLLPDECDLAAGTITDCNFNGEFDPCEPTATILADCSACALDNECDDGLACTTDSCFDSGGHCNFTLDAGSCRIDAACHLVGGVNPSNDCEECDVASPLGWTTVPPVEVPALDLEALASTRLTWSAQAHAVYDVSGGDLATLRLDGGVDGAACLASDLATAEWDDPRADPAVGAGFYYLVRARKDCGGGSWGRDGDGAKRSPSTSCP